MKFKRKVQIFIITLLLFTALIGYSEPNFEIKSRYPTNSEIADIEIKNQHCSYKCSAGFY